MPGQKQSAKRGSREIAQSRAFAIDAARSLADDRCREIVVLDLNGRSQVTDFFVVATGTSDRQMRSAAFAVNDVAKRHRFSLFRSNKDEREQTWIVMDFVDVVVHVFEPNTRAHYDIETLWGESERVDWTRPDRPEDRRLTLGGGFAPDEPEP